MSKKSGYKVIGKRRQWIMIQDSTVYDTWKKKRTLVIKNIASWSKIRKKILARDGFTCRICGADDISEKLHIHHKDYDRANNKDANLVTLCSPCHREIHLEGYRPSNDDYPEPWGIDKAD